jgi:hypothetical protein
MLLVTFQLAKKLKLKTVREKSRQTFFSYNFIDSLLYSFICELRKTKRALWCCNCNEISSFQNFFCALFVFAGLKMLRCLSHNHRFVLLIIIVVVVLGRRCCFYYLSCRCCDVFGKSNLFVGFSL